METVHAKSLQRGWQCLRRLCIPHASGERYIGVYHGDLTDAGPDDAVDLVVVSAFPDDYAPVAGTLIGALQDRGVSVEALSCRKAVDLCGAFSCWLSEEVRGAAEGIRFRRILCFEPFRRGLPADVVGELFQSLMPFAHGTPSVARVAMPLVACGNQGVTVGEMFEPLVDAAMHWFQVGLPIRELHIVEQSRYKAEEMARLLEGLTQHHRAILRAPTEPFHYDAFVSYARSDEPAVRILVEEMRRIQPSLRVFVDHMEINAGAAWQQVIFDALDDCRAVIAMYSPQYLESRVCKEEFNIAFLRRREITGVALLPIYLFSASLPSYMRILQLIDCREGDEKRLAAAGRRIIDALLPDP